MTAAFPGAATSWVSGWAARAGFGHDVRMRGDISGACAPLIARMISVPLTSDSVAPPRLVYGSLDVGSDAARDESYTALYFEIAGSGALGRITFEGLDAIKAARGELLPYGVAEPRKAGGWVFTVEESPWLAERHHYEMRLYSTALLETCQHYVFQFHDEFVEAIAEGIWPDIADPSSPFGTAQHPLDQLPDSIPSQRFLSPSGIEWELRRSPRANSELIEGSHLCSQRVCQFNLLLDGSTTEGASIWLRTRNGLTVSRFVRPWPARELARLDGLAQPNDFTEAWETCLAAIAERRRQMGR
jgi:hypothetical protein